jgi:hypothetical protein
MRIALQYRRLHWWSHSSYAIRVALPLNLIYGFGD